MQNRKAPFVIVAFCLSLFIFLALALAQVGSGSSCHWVFPKWFGCVVAAHENLAAGLIGAAGALIAAWIAWTAVQEQINSERERAAADRVEVERILSEDLTEYAKGMAAAWRLLVALPEDASQDHTSAVYQTTAYMADRVSRPERITSYRAMVEILGWDRRIKYSDVIDRLSELRKFSDPESMHDSQEVLDAIRTLADYFELCLPDTSEYFNGLWRRSVKAMSFADLVEYNVPAKFRGDQSLERSPRTGHQTGDVLAKGNILKLWSRLSAEDRKIIEFAALHCGPSTNRPPLLTLEDAIAALREVSRISHGHGREALDVVEKLKRLSSGV
jgi:hypothetical protein